MPELPPIETVLDAAAGALRHRAEELRAEQMPKGLDALAEVGFHPLLAAGFEAIGLHVLREQPFPDQPGPRRSARERCDLVLLPPPHRDLADPPEVERERKAAEATLFGAALPPAPRGCDPEDAFWLEVKLVAQHCYTHGVPGPNRAYSSELLSIAPKDILKLARDRRIRHAGLLLILMTDSEATARHDVGVLVGRLAEQDAPIRSPITDRFAIPDHVGNACCSLALIPVRPLGPDGL